MRLQVDNTATLNRRVRRSGLWSLHRSAGYSRESGGGATPRSEPAGLGGGRTGYRADSTGRLASWAANPPPVRGV